MDKSSNKNFFSKVLIITISTTIFLLTLLFLLYFFILKDDRNFKVEFKNTEIIILILTFAIVTNMIYYLWYSKKHIQNPMDLIQQILTTDNSKAIDDLKEHPGEFGSIGQLLEQSKNQKIALQNLKDKAEESDQLKSTFLANLSHEIRTPMNAIMGFSNLLRSNDLNENEKISYIDIIDKSGENLVLIIDDLIEMSKLDSKQVSPNNTSIDLENSMSDLYNAYKITIPKSKKINFYRIESLKPAKQNIIVDEVKLKQIITNLLSNAVKYTDDGEVSFGYEVDKGTKQIKFVVKDTGLGIERQNQHYIFDRFRRVEDDQAIKVGGLGLGLAISKAYVELMEGSIYMESNVGEGSVFTFSIPLNFDTSMPVMKIVPKVEEFGSNETGTILIAEDDNINYLFFEKIMQFKSYTILRASNGQEAVTICTENPDIDLVLMDIKMPVMDGYQAFSEIKKIKPNLPIIAQTAYSSIEDKNKIIDAGFSSYITKPLNRDKLFEMINQFMKK